MNIGAMLLPAATAAAVLALGCGGRTGLSSAGSGGASPGGDAASSGPPSAAGSASGGGGTGPRADGHQFPCNEVLEAWVSASGDCGGRTPCYSVLQDAVDAVETVTTIWVLPGTYRPKLDPAAHGHVFEMTERVLCLRSVEGPEVTILDGGGAGTVVSAFAGNIVAAWIEGFSIRGAGLEGYGLHVGADGRPRAWIVGNVFEHNELGRGALMIESGSSDLHDVDILVSGNIFRFNAGPSEHATVEIEVRADGDHAGLIRIENNLIADNSHVGLKLLAVPEGKPLRREVVNNTIARNSIGLNAIVDGLALYNNILAGNDDDAPYLDQAGDPSVRHNLFGSAPDFAGSDGNVDAEPGFVDPAAGDYHLRPDSAAIAAGTPDLAPPVDLEWVPRDETAPDIGAFESP